MKKGLKMLDTFAQRVISAPAWDCVAVWGRSCSRPIPLDTNSGTEGVGGGKIAGVEDGMEWESTAGC